MNTTEVKASRGKTAFSRDTVLFSQYGETEVNTLTSRDKIHKEEKYGIHSQN
jgi:hypothetical protein